jgi:hypothetical protein
MPSLRVAIVLDPSSSAYLANHVLSASKSHAV